MSFTLEKKTMKWIFALMLSLLSFSSFAANMYLACPQALPTNHSDFCPSFKSVAKCHCTASGLPERKCQNMENIYQLMIDRFGSVRKACEFQHDTSTQVCIDDWTCYRLGGKDSAGHLCSSTAKACKN